MIKKIEEWWNREKKVFRKWMKWRKAEKQMSSKEARKEFNDYSDMMDQVFDIDPRAVICESAKETFSFVNHVTVSPSKVLIDCHPETMGDMTELLRWFAKQDLHQISDSQELPDQSYREWNLEKIMISAWFESNKPNSCKYVEIGKREVPVMKMVCPGDEDYPKEKSEVSLES